VATGDAGGAVDEHENHAAEGPGDGQDAGRRHRMSWTRPASCGHRDVDEEQRGNELGVGDE
jgi:hypothetical protein